MLRTVSHLILSALLICTLYLFGKIKQYYLQYSPNNIEVKNIKVQSPDSIIAQNDSLIIPVNYLGTMDFRQLEPELRKMKFIQYLLPAVVIIRQRLLDDMHHIEFIEDKLMNKKEIYSEDSLFLDSMKVKYNTDSIPELIKRIYPHPVSLALTQAVLESGWGTSSIARKGHNLFGILSFSPDESRLKMQLNDSEDDIYLRTYSNITESVENYYLIVSRSSLFKEFREKRWEGASASKLLYLLDNYHENEQYAELGNSIMKTNSLEKYDNLTVDPAYEKDLSLYAYLKKN